MPYFMPKAVNPSDYPLDTFYNEQGYYQGYNIKSLEDGGVYEDDKGIRPSDFFFNTAKGTRLEHLQETRIFHPIELDCEFDSDVKDLTQEQSRLFTAQITPINRETTLVFSPDKKEGAIQLKPHHESIYQAYLETVGFTTKVVDRVTLRQLTTPSEYQEVFNTLTLCIYGHTLKVDVTKGFFKGTYTGKVFEYDWRYQPKKGEGYWSDKKYLSYRKYNPNGYENNTEYELPLIAYKFGVAYAVTLKIEDFGSVQGIASLADFASNSDVNLPFKKLFTRKYSDLQDIYGDQPIPHKPESYIPEIARMSEFYNSSNRIFKDNSPIQSLESFYFQCQHLDVLEIRKLADTCLTGWGRILVYGCGDNIVHYAYTQYSKLWREKIYKGLGAERQFITPGKTFGSTISKLIEGLVCERFGVDRNESKDSKKLAYKLIKDLMSRASAQGLRMNVYSNTVKPFEENLPNEDDSHLEVTNKVQSLESLEWLSEQIENYHDLSPTEQRKALRNLSNKALEDVDGTTLMIMRKVFGGRAYRAIESANVFHDVNDIDISGAYGTIMSALDICLGRIETYYRPVIKGKIQYPSKNDKKDNGLVFHSFLDFMQKTKGCLLKGKYSVMIDIEESLYQPQNFLPSYTPPKKWDSAGTLLCHLEEDDLETPKNKRELNQLLRSDILSLEDRDYLDSFHEIDYYTSQARFVNVTTPVKDWVDEIATESLQYQFYERSRVVAALWYDQTRYLPFDEFKTLYLDYLNTPEKYKHYDSKKGKMIYKDSQGNKLKTPPHWLYWTFLNMGDLFVTPVLKFRAENKALKKKQVKGSDLERRYDAYQTLFKLVNNTAYGTLASRFFNGNVVVMNTVTAFVRSVVWMLETGLITVQSITDGGAFEILRVLQNVKKGGKNVRIDSTCFQNNYDPITGSYHQLNQHR